MSRYKVIFLIINLCCFTENTFSQPTNIAVIEKRIDSLLSIQNSSTLEHIQLMKLIKWDSYLLRDFISIPPVRPPQYNIKVTSKFGKRIHPIKGYLSQHSGIDLVPINGNDTIYATASGYIDTIAYNPLLGYHIIVQHRFGYKTIYGHLAQVLIKPKQHIHQAEIIAIMGNTGQSTGKHLHYSVKHNNTHQDPYPFCYIFFDAIIKNNIKL